MLIELKNGKRKEVREAQGKALIKARIAREITEEVMTNRSMADKPKVQKIADASEVFTPAEELDSDGNSWNPDLHTASKIKNQDGTWRKKPGARTVTESDE